MLQNIIVTSKLLSDISLHLLLYKVKTYSMGLTKSISVQNIVENCLISIIAENCLSQNV